MFPFQQTQSFKENNQAMKINRSGRAQNLGKVGRRGSLLECHLMIPIFSLYKQSVYRNGTFIKLSLLLSCIYEIPSPYVGKMSFKHFSL
jgi:hypothetical protein